MLFTYGSLWFIMFPYVRLRAQPWSNIATHSGTTMYGLRERELRVVADPDAERTTRGSTGATGGDSGLRGSWVYQCDS